MIAGFLKIPLPITPPTTIDIVVINPKVGRNSF
jgi:hypothetical protein